MLPRTYDDQACSVARALEVLGDRLQRLTDEGLLERHRYQERPERFEYRLSEKGIDLWPAIVTLMKWGDRYYAPPAGPPRVVRHRDCGGEVTLNLTCDTCGAQLDAADVQLEPGP